MKKNYQKQIILSIIGFLSLFLANAELSAQCSDVTLILTGKNPTCPANGSIKVAITGPDAVNIRQSDMQFQVSSATVNWSWSPYSNDSIPNLPAETYTIELRAFCYAANDYVVFNTSATTTLTSSYVELDAVVGLPRATLNCKPTGMIPITIMNNTGSVPFTITMTNNPGTYTGPKTFVTSTRGTPYQITDLPDGNYTFTVADACTYTKTINATVGTMAQDFNPLFVYDYLYSPTTPMPGQCDIVTLLLRQLYSNYTNDERHYFYSNAADYYQIAFLVNNIGVPVYMDIPTDQFFNWQLPSQTIRWLRENDATISVYMSIKGTGCSQLLKNVRISAPDNYFTYSDIGCDSLTVSHYPYNNLSGRLICYPYRWRVFRSDNTPFQGWSGLISDYSTQVVRVPLGARIEYEDSEGYTWSKSVPSTPLSVSYSSQYSPPYQTNGINADGTYNSYMYIYLPNSGIFPAGTRFQYVSASGPKTPIHTDTTIIAAIYNFYPFSPNYTSLVRDSIPAGTYQFTVTIPGCSPQTITINHYNYKIVTPFSYTTKETCGGLYVFPSGQLGLVYPTGTVNNVNTYYQLFSVVPSSIPIDTRIITAADSLFLPTTGMYRLGMNYTNSYTYESWVDTIFYTQTPFTLDPSKTSSYVCEDESLGFIRVAGMGGSGNYAYELYDDVGTFIASNTTGVFSHGTAGNNYTIRLIDTDPACAASYDQVVYMLDLGIAQIAYSNNPTNTFCLSDSVYLRCLTLGQTSYLWSGHTALAGKETLQNPVIYAGDLGVGTHTFTITVTPEGCGHEMVQSVTVTVEDCSGAHDDYKIIFINTPDTIDVLANDKFPASCASSVVPVITVGPMHGTASVVNNKVFYTPALDFLGKDSITYSTTCGSTTTTAKVYISVIEMPDNITDANCVIAPAAMVWDIREIPMNKNVLVHNYGPLVAGDLFGDDTVRIVGFIPKNGSQNNYDSDGLRIFYMKNGQVTHMKDISFNAHTAATFGAMVIARYNNTGYIVVCGSNGYLYAYNATTGNRIWQSIATSGSTTNGSIVNIADFNNDGIPEVYTGNRIFSLATGALLCDGGSNNMGTLVSGIGFSTIAADIDDDGLLELCAGTQIYKVNIPQGATTAGSGTMSVISDMQLNTLPPNAGADGATTVADIDNDGQLEIVVTTLVSSRVVVYVWKPLPNNASYLLGSYLVPATSVGYYAIPMIGNIDDDPYPEIVFITNGSVFNMYALEYDTLASLGSRISAKWTLTHTDGSGCTGMSLFDFNLDGVNEIVYRDEQTLRIINGNTNTTPTPLRTFVNVRSGTLRELPIIADVDGDGQAEIVIQGWDNDSAVNPAGGSTQNGYLRVFKSNGSKWAPARKVWNQYAYNAVNINEDLTVPLYQLNPGTLFPGQDGIFGTTDDLRPYNGFMMQQTIIDKKGVPMWLAPDATPVPSLSSIVSNGSTVTLTIAVFNDGDAAIGSPVHYSVYRDSITAGMLLFNDSAMIQINAGMTETITVNIPDITIYPPLVKIIVRINDKGGAFPFELECDTTNNVIDFINPALHLLMTKDATLLPSFADNGTFANPVSILFSEEIRYEITAVNANYSTGNVIIRDTLPIYLKHMFGSVESVTPVSPSDLVIDTGTITGPFQRDTLRWRFSNVPSMATRTVRFRATPLQGAVASQPMFDNRAWVQVSDTLFIPTNYTWHQGASVSLVTFSAGFGGKIYQAMEQVLDYRTSPQSGIVIVPDEGYRFAGWSHPDYLSLRGETIRAQNGIMYYETLIVYGNVELHANFELEEYPITYYLHGGYFPDSPNSQSSMLHASFPDFFTIESESITLGTPEKADDVFIGWTGSNGDEPQLTVTIPHGSTGERTYYANYLYSERREFQPDEMQESDKIWAAENEIYIRTAKPGKIVRIYSMEGILLKQQIILHTGETTIKMARGVYSVTLNNGIGQKIMISD